MIIYSVAFYLRAFFASGVFLILFHKYFIICYSASVDGLVRSIVCQKVKRLFVEYAKIVVIQLIKVV